MFDVDLVERYAQRVDDREQSACIDIRNPAGDDDGVLVSGNEAPCQMLRQHIDILLQRTDVWLASLNEPAPQGLERPDIADTGLPFENGLDFRDHGKGVRRKERCALRKFNEYID